MAQMPNDGFAFHTVTYKLYKPDTKTTAMKVGVSDMLVCYYPQQTLLGTVLSRCAFDNA